jgi:hypothetical protein
LDDVFLVLLSSFLNDIFKGVVNMKILMANEVAFVSGGSDWSEGSTGGDRPPDSIFANDFNCFVAMILDGMTGSNYSDALCKK